MPLYDEPMFFERNRVSRVYTGGALFADFFGDRREDGHFPEEWIASDVRACNTNSSNDREGVSKISGTDMYLDEALRKYPREILGERSCLGVLTKLLDSAVRLPVQTHPTRDFARKYLNSSFGKQEAWLVLDVREGAKIYYGFRDGVTRADLEQAVLLSEADGEAMSRLLCSYDVKPGDVIFIPAGMAHAIGGGCLLLEAQEPTDFTIQPERWCGSYRLSDDEMYLGLDKQTALGCFNMNLRYALPLEPVAITEGNGVRYESLIGEKQTDCFTVRRITLAAASFVPKEAAGVYVVTGGDGVLRGENYSRRLRKGDYFLLPYRAAGNFALCASGGMTVAETCGNR